MSIKAAAAFSLMMILASPSYAATSAVNMCAVSVALTDLAQQTGADTSELLQLRTFACGVGSGAGTGSIFYPNGKYAYVGPGFADTGSWYYPGGKYAYVSGNYQDAGSYYYPSGKFAFAGPSYSDAGSWYYPSGKYAYVSGNFQDAGSYYYTSGKFAFAGPAYSNAGSWYYPNGKYAYVQGNFSDAGSWYYPNGNIFLQNGPRTDDGRELVAVVELYQNTHFWDRNLRALPPVLQVVERILWVEGQLAGQSAPQAAGEGAVP